MFKGGIFTLRKRLGLRREWLPRSQYLLRQRQRDRAGEAARALYRLVQKRRLELLENLRGLGSLELKAHKASAGHPATWGALALVYRERPATLAELVILENCWAPDLVRFFAVDDKTRQEAIGRVLAAGL
jgi:hypothetical protein